MTLETKNRFWEELNWNYNKVMIIVLNIHNFIHFSDYVDRISENLAGIQWMLCKVHNNFRETFPDLRLPGKIFETNPESNEQGFQWNRSTKDVKFWSFWYKKY